MNRNILRIVKRSTLAIFALAVVGLAFLRVAALEWPRPSGSIEARVAITDVNVVDIERGEILPNHTVVIENGVITRVGPAESVNVSNGYTTIGAVGQYMIPGLWDMHVHFINPLLAKFSAPMMVTNGVFYVREMWGDCIGGGCGYLSPIKQMRDIQADAVEGEILAPRIMGIAGYVVDGPRMGYERRGRPKDPSYLVPSNAAEGRHLARYFRDRGVDFIKPYDSLPRDAYFAVLDEAKILGIEVAGHVPKSVTMVEAIEAGQRSIEHARMLPMACSARGELYQTAYSAWASSDYPPSDDNPNVDDVNLPDWYAKLLEAFDQKKCDSILNKWALADSYYVPTHLTRYAQTVVQDAPYDDDLRSKYIPESEIEGRWRPETKRYKKLFDDDPKLAQAYSDYFVKGLELTGDAHLAGVKIMAGTDAPFYHIYPGFSLHDELGFFVQAGMSPSDALRAATITPAKFEGVFDSFGSIEEGKSGEFVLLNANPLLDISNTKEIASIYYNQRYYDLAELQKVQDHVASKASGVRHYLGIAWYKITRPLVVFFYR